MRATEGERERVCIEPACLLLCMPAACCASQSLLSRFCAAPCCCSCGELNILSDCRGEYTKTSFYSKPDLSEIRREEGRESSNAAAERERVKSALRTRMRRRMSVKRQTGKKSKQHDQLLYLWGWGKSGSEGCGAQPTTKWRCL